MVNTDQYLIKLISALIVLVRIVLLIFPTRICRIRPNNFRTQIEIFSCLHMRRRSGQKVVDFQ